MSAAAASLVAFPTPTSCGMLSRSEMQTGWAVQTARSRIARTQPHLEHLTDEDIVWLLLRGWEP